MVGRPRRLTTLPAGLLLVAGGAAFALELRHVWPFTADDAFITFRYAQNWVAGQGPNFNAGGPRAEGVTSFGYLLLCTLPQLVGIDAVAFAKALGVASALATAGLAAAGFAPARDALRERRACGEALAATHVRLGHVLADYRRETARAPLLAIGDAGAVPYYSGLRVIDTYSLNEPAIAIDGRDEPAYVLDQHPDLVALVSEQGREFRAHWANRHDGPLFDACRAHGMQPAVILPFSARSFVYLMAQPDSEIARYLKRVYLGDNRPG